jgi:hypothetical protein
MPPPSNPPPTVQVNFLQVRVFQYWLLTEENSLFIHEYKFTQQPFFGFFYVFYYLVDFVLRIVVTSSVALSVCVLFFVRFVSLG